MLTAEKIEEFKKYKGYYDGYYMQNKNNEHIISDLEWGLLSSLVQDIYLIRKGLASKVFEQNAVTKLNEICESVQVSMLVYELEKYLNGGNVSE